VESRTLPYCSRRRKETIMVHAGADLRLFLIRVYLGRLLQG
jgi:hypothetical protein